MHANLKNKPKELANIQYPPCEIIGAVDSTVTAVQMVEGVTVRLAVRWSSGVMFVIHNTAEQHAPAVLVEGKGDPTIEALFTPEELAGHNFPVGAKIEVWAYFSIIKTPVAIYTIVA
ncbi:MAG TPA: hypothetical protein VF671_18530 [Pseudomonas sp.]|jgi:hypothetical protein|uniref:hypothetical protein n=1 Tax=Pseudomonas sp. TaxID=306 RepID=UPI002EDAD7EF